MAKETRFWTFSQNNSGGKFDYQPNDGITHYVIVEATDLIHALARAADIGLYFNGCDSGTDCPCCGDRWDEPWDEKGDAEPMVYSTKAAEYGGASFCRSLYSLFTKGEICIHHLDGRKEWLAPPSDASEAA